MFSLARRSMGKRCSKKAVMCGAIGVLVLASAIGSLSLASLDAACRRDSLTVPRYRARRSGWLLACLDRVFPRLRSCSPSHGKLFGTVSNVPHQLRHGFQIPIRVGHLAMTEIGR